MCDGLVDYLLRMPRSVFPDRSMQGKRYAMLVQLAVMAASAVPPPPSPSPPPACTGHTYLRGQGLPADGGHGVRFERGRGREVRHRKLSLAPRRARCCAPRSLSYSICQLINLESSRFPPMAQACPCHNSLLSKKRSVQLQAPS